MSTFTETYLEETTQIVAALDAAAIDRLAAALAAVRDGGGRLFVLGVGDPPRTRHTRCATSGSCAASRHTRRPTTWRS